MDEESNYQIEEEEIEEENEEEEEEENEEDEGGPIKGGDDKHDDEDDDEDDDDFDGDNVPEEEEEEEGKENYKKVDETSSDSEEEEEEEEDDDYLQKLDNHVRQKVIEDHHPELKTLNYEEVEALAVIIRDKNNNIIDQLHRTLPMMTRYEKARILGERARQINSGAKPMIVIEPTIIDGYLIALQELEQKRIPFIIQRPLPNGGSEYWRVADLEQ